MISDGMSFCCHTFYQIRIGFDVGADNKKCRFYIVLFQRVQNSRCVAVFKSGVEGQVNHFVFRVFCIIGVKLFQFLHGRICNRRLSFALKA